MSELKPCPWCKVSARHEDDHVYSDHEDWCPLFERMPMLCSAESWNRRASPVDERERELLLRLSSWLGWGPGSMEWTNVSDMETRIKQGIDHHINVQAEMRTTEKTHARERALRDEISKLKTALIWCSGSGDFQEGGIARKGWVTFCKPLIDDAALSAVPGGEPGYVRVVREAIVECTFCRGAWRLGQNEVHWHDCMRPSPPRDGEEKAHE